MSQWASFCCVALIGLAPSAGRAATLDLHGEVLNLAVDTTVSESDQAVLGGRAALSARLSNFGANLRLGAQGGSDDFGDQAFWARNPTGGVARWTSGSLGVGAAWTPSPKASLEAEFSNWIRSDLAAGAAPVWGATANTWSRASEDAARVAATLTPFAATPLSLQIAGESSQRTQETVLIEAASRAAADPTRSRSQLVSADLHWTPRPWLDLDGGWKAETVGASQRGEHAATTAFAYMAPRIAGTATPWDGLKLRLSFEETVPSLSDDLTTRLDQLSETLADGTVRLDKERRYRAAVEQRLFSNVQFSAAMTAAELQSPAMAPGAALASFDAGGRRREIEAALVAPVRLSAWTPLTLKARAAVRSSQVGDPITGGVRRVSGEAPYDAALSIGGGDSGRGIRWEIVARAIGPAVSYQPDQISDLSGTTGLGGSITYRPGPVNISLELVNVIGGGQSSRDTYFEGSRLAGMVGRIEEGRNANRAFRIKLSRPL